MLLVDDDLVCTTAYRRILEANGFSVEVAKNGADGLASLKREQADAILLDVFMPYMSGIDMIRAIRAKPNYSLIPIIILTSANLPTVREMALAAGASCVFDKTNDKPISVVGYLHDILKTTTSAEMTLLSKTGNPDAFLDYEH